MNGTNSAATWFGIFRRCGITIVKMATDNATVDRGLHRKDPSWSINQDPLRLGTNDVGNIVFGESPERVINGNTRKAWS